MAWVFFPLIELASQHLRPCGDPSWSRFPCPVKASLGGIILSAAQSFVLPHNHRELLAYSVSGSGSNQSCHLLSDVSFYGVDRFLSWEVVVVEPVIWHWWCVMPPSTVTQSQLWVGKMEQCFDKWVPSVCMLCTDEDGHTCRNTLVVEGNVALRLVTMPHLCEWIHRTIDCLHKHPHGALRVKIKHLVLKKKCFCYKVYFKFKMLLCMIAVICMFNSYVANS